MPALPTHLDILLVEDNPADARLLELVFAEKGLHVTTHHVADGDAALRYLRVEGEHADAPRPDLVLLDLDLPGTDGREVLRTIKADARLRTIPVMICSGSKVPEDVHGSYHDRANAFVAKPLSLEGYEQAARAIVAFWQRTAALPPKVLG